MNKEEYAQFHYLLAKLKYELCETMATITNNEYFLELQRQIEEIDDIAKITIITAKEKEYADTMTQKHETN